MAKTSLVLPSCLHQCFQLSTKGEKLRKLLKTFTPSWSVSASFHTTKLWLYLRNWNFPQPKTTHNFCWRENVVKVSQSYPRARRRVWGVGSNREKFNRTINSEHLNCVCARAMNEKSVMARVFFSTASAKLLLEVYRRSGTLSIASFRFSSSSYSKITWITHFHTESLFPFRLLLDFFFLLFFSSFLEMCVNLMKKSGKVVWVGENENEDAGKCDE